MKYIYELINIGKGEYGTGSLQITAQNLLLIYEGECWNAPPDEECCIDIYDSGSLMPRRGALDFVRMQLFDDELNDKTIIRAKTITTVGDYPPSGSTTVEGDEWINNCNWKRYKFYDGFWVEVHNGVSQIEFINSGSLEPVNASYTSQAEMISAQNNQRPNYIYFDGTSYWEYLGTFNGDITDYRDIGSGTVIAELSVDGVVLKGIITQTGNNLTLNDVWQWRIDNIVYNPIGDTTLNFPFTTNGYQRIDLIVGNNLGVITRVAGPEVVIGEPMTAPTPPANTIPLAEVTVLDTGIASFIEFALSSFVRYDINSQGLSPVQRQNARTNIQAVSKDVNDTITSFQWEFRDQVNNQLKMRFRQGSQGAERLYFIDMFRDGGDQQLRYLTGVPQTGLGTQFPNFRWKAVGTATRTLTTWLDGNDNPIFSMLASGASQFFNSAPIHPRSTSVERSVRRDELPFNYPQTVATAGVIDNLDINDDTKLLILTLADELTGVVPVTTTLGRELKIECRRVGGVIIRHEGLTSTVTNRFSLPGSTDLTIANGEVYTFIYTNGKWRTEPKLIFRKENLDVDLIAPGVVAEIPSSVFTAAFFDYSVKNGTNLRAGTIMATHDGTNVIFTEMMTQDLGNTAGVDLTVELNAGLLQLIATVDSDNWIIKSLVRGI